MSGDTGYSPPGAFVTHMIKHGFKRWRPINPARDFEIHSLDLTSLKLDVSRFTPFLISKRLSSRSSVTAENLELELPGAEAAAKKAALAFLVLGGTVTEGAARVLTEEVGPSKIVVLDKSDIDVIQKAADHDAKAKLLSLAIVREVGREQLSPYTTGQPAAGGRFFARSEYVKQIVRGASSFTVVGNRRIGKTSLLNEIKEQLSLHNENHRIAEVYGASCHSTLDVVFDILQKLDQFRSANRVVEFPYDVRNLPEYIHAIPKTEKRAVTVIIDELDHILAFDEKQNNELLHLLRATFYNRPPCRIIMAGFRKVMESVSRLDHPLYNFGRIIELPLFSRQETYEMVKKPLDHLGIDLASSDLPETIFRETSGHPELIQVHCAEIVRHVEATGEVPDETTHLTRVFESTEYKQKVLGAFLANTNAHEELLCYLLIADGENAGNAADYEFSLQDVNRVLNGKGLKYNLNRINILTNNLKMSGIISRVRGANERFRFSVPQFTAYCSSLDLNFCIEKALEKIEDSSDAVSTP